MTSLFPAILSYVLLHTLVVIIFGISVRGMVRFLREHDMILNQQDLERYKVLVRFEMKAALGSLPLLIATGASQIRLSSALSTDRVYNPLPMAGLLIFFGGAYVHNSYMKRLKALEAGTLELAKEHRRISETWSAKALPDF